MTTNLYDQMEQSLHKLNLPYRREEALSKHTSFRIGGPCRMMLFPQDHKQVIASVKLVKRLEERNEIQIPTFILGNGSNILVSDDGFDGVVITLGSNYSKITQLNERELLVTAGTNLNTLCQYAQRHGLSGLEFAFGIPGSVGGAVFMNAGAYGGEMKNVVTCVHYLDEEGNVGKYGADQLDFSYRHSAFSSGNKIILAAVYTLQTGDKDAIRAQMLDYLGRRKEKQPLEYPSAGSTFKRPEGHFAGQLIEQAGLKGFSVGGAQVSEKHAGFVINRDRATAADVQELIRQVQEKVKENAGVELECEVRFLQK